MLFSLVFIFLAVGLVLSIVLEVGSGAGRDAIEHHGETHQYDESPSLGTAGQSVHLFNPSTGLPMNGASGLDVSGRRYGIK